MKVLQRRYSHVRGALTATQLAVLKLISEGRHLGEYVPEYRPGARRGIGAFPVTIAARAAEQLRKKGLVERDETGDRLRPTRAGWELTLVNPQALARPARI